MSPPDFLTRLRKGRLVQVLVVYVGASWAVLEVADVLTDALALPSWISPLVVLLLLVGLLIVLATAWIQTHPVVTERAAADEVPSSWELDVPDLRQAIKGGRFPHLTWPRALLGGVVAFSLLFGGAGLYVLFNRPGLPPLVAVEGAAPGVAVLPFDARGVEEELWSEGLVDLVSTNLDGVGGLRAIDSRTVLARWRESRGAAQGDLTRQLDVARAAGARFAVVGSATGVGDQVRVTARLYDLSDGTEVGAGQVEGAPDDVLSLVDAISVDLLQDLLAGVGGGVAARSLARITTSSVPALRAFLRGEAAIRGADFPAAIDAYEEALAQDSTFALAAARLSMAYGWTESRGSEASLRYQELAARHSHRLPARDAALLQAAEGVLGEGDPAALRTLSELAASYPDDPDVWTLLGEGRWHLGPMVLIPESQSMEAFERAIALDSTFAPAYIHLLEDVMGASRDSVEARRLLEAYARVSEEDLRLRTLRLAFDLTFDPPEALPGDLSFPGIEYTVGSLIRAGYRTLPQVRHVLTLVLESGNVPPGVRDFLAAEQLFQEADAGLVDRVLANAAGAPEPAWTSALALLVVDYGVTLPDGALEQVFAFDSGSDLRWVQEAGLAAARLGRDTVVSRAVSLLRSAQDQPVPDGPVPQGQLVVTERQAQAWADAVEAYAAWQAGDPGAADGLEAVQEATIDYETEELNEVVRLWLGLLHMEADRPRRALTYLRSVRYIPLAGLLLAEAYEAAGQASQAAAAYADMVRVWADADDDFEPLERARRGLERTRLDD